MFMPTLEELKAIPEKKRKKYYYHQLKKLQKEYRPAKEYQTNPTWKKEWLPFIAKDHDWDWGYLFDLILYKLEKMQLSLCLFSIGTEEWFSRIHAELQEAIDLGHKILDTESVANSPSYIFLKDNVTNYTVIFSKETHETLATLPNKDNELFADCKEARKWREEHGYKLEDVYFGHRSLWNSKEAEQHYKEMCDNEEKQLQEDYDKFFQLIAKNLKGWWD